MHFAFDFSNLFTVVMATAIQTGRGHVLNKIHIRAMGQQQGESYLKEVKEN